MDYASRSDARELLEPCFVVFVVPDPEEDDTCDCPNHQNIPEIGFLGTVVLISTSAIPRGSWSVIFTQHIKCLLKFFVIRGFHELAACIIRDRLQKSRIRI